MVDIRPLLFINFLMLLLLASAGFVHLQEQSYEDTITAAPTTNSSEGQTNAEALASSNSTLKDSDSNEQGATSDSSTQENAGVEDEPLFVDQLPGNEQKENLTTAAEIKSPVSSNTSEQTASTPEQTAKTETRPEPAQVVTGALEVRSNVYGDTVLINGKPYGSSALEVNLSPGTYDVEVTKPGFQSWKQSIYITRGSEQSIYAELQKFTTVNYKNGSWEHGVQTGEGRYQDGARIDYQGSFVNGQFHGYGSARYGDGSRYQGEWFEGRRKGQGTFVDANGDTYVGQFSGDAFNGDGTLTKANGDIYTGYWIDGELNGQGSLTTRDGLLYVGGFSDNLFHGNGTLTYPDGGNYEGSFSNGLFHGKGVEIYSNGKKYEGQFIEGLYHGKGEILNPNGSKISGTFKDGEPFGKVTLTTAEGEVFTARSSEPGICYRPKSYRATQCPKPDGW